MTNCRPISQINSNNSHSFQSTGHQGSIISVPDIQYVTDVTELLQGTNIPSMLFLVGKFAFYFFIFELYV